MTTNPDQSHAEQLNSRHGPFVDDSLWSQSTAIRGAAKAFTADGNGQRTKALENSTNGALAAAVSAGYASRQNSLSPPRAFASALTPSYRLPSAGASQVQQLVRGYEQSATRARSQKSETDSSTPSRLMSRSPSQVAARIASRTSPLREPLPVRSEAKKNSSMPDRDATDSHENVNHTGASSPSKVAKSEDTPGHVTTPFLPRPTRPVSVAKSVPAMLSSKQLSRTENDLGAVNVQKQPSRDVSSTRAAQAAVRNTIAQDSSHVIAPHWAEGDVSNSNGIAPAKSDHGQNLNVSRQTVRNEVAVRNAANGSKPDEAHPTTSNHDSVGGNSRRRSASKPQPYTRTQSAHSRPRFPSMSSAQYIDERTGLTEVSLADAIVASSLASSRAPSPARQVPAPPPPRRSSVSRSLFRRHHSSETDLPRHASPYKGMRQTLRKYDSDDDDEDTNARRKHRHFMKHPNKHREGSRQRWKDKVTERERKRYEGVWAANKGMFLTEAFSNPNLEAIHETPLSELVLDLVVRDIWNRSRLPAETLAEIWDLVDRQGVGTLARDEFVVGLWLIDQRLKGRKLPIRVSATLWASVRHAWGVRVPRKL